MTSVSNDDHRRNRPGLQFHRQRVMNRALTVAQDPLFRERIRRARTEWNEEFPTLRIRTFDSMSDWEGSDATEVTRGMDEEIRVPRGSLEYIVNNTSMLFRVDFRWERMLGDICEEFWPERFFPKMGRFQHPAFRFVEACLYCEIVYVADRVDALIPGFTTALHYLPWEPVPFDHWYQEVVIGERNFWRKMALEAISSLAGEPFPDDFMERNASSAGIEYAREQGVSIMDVDDKPPEEMYWFLPVTPFMSTQDVKSITPRIVEVSRMLAGSTYLDDLILELKAEGLNHEDVASRLGVSIDMVKRAIRKTSK